MQSLIRKVFKIYKYLSFIFIIGFYIFLIIDDYTFIVEYWRTNWLEYIAFWTAYVLVYLVAFSIYFWGISSLIIWIYFRIFLRK